MLPPAPQEHDSETALFMRLSIRTSHFALAGCAEAIGMGSALYRAMPRKHTELICWQLSDELRQMIIRLTETDKAAKDLRFTNNLRDAISSACRNQSEGFYKYYHRQQRPFFNTARASLGETLDGIRDGYERRYFSEEDAKTMEALCNRAMKATLRWLKSLKRPDPDE